MSTTMARMMELSSPLGKDLLFRELRGREELGRPSAFELSALSTRADIKPSDLLGKSITVKLELVKGGFRYFNGYVTRFSQGTIVGKYYEYQMTVSAWLWFLTRTADCKIFQEKAAPEIIKEVFGDHKMAIFEDALSGSYAKREYTVQYRETDFAFISRIMEEEGIYYYFEHKDGKHTLKLVDSESGHKKLENKASIAYYPPGRALHGEGSLRGRRSRGRTRSSFFLLLSFLKNFLDPISVGPLRMHVWNRCLPSGEGFRRRGKEFHEAFDVG